MRSLSYPIILFLLILILGSLGSLFIVSYAKPWQTIFDDYLYDVLSFSLKQAFISSFLSLIIGLLMTRSHIHATNSSLKKFVGKALGLPFILPTMVMIQILLHLFGHNGWFKLPFSMYSESGIIFTHIILNVPFVVFLMRQVWEEIPQEHWRTAKHLGFSSWQFWKIIEWPMVRSYLLHAFVPVFLLCFTSFTPVLILSPTPTQVTLEVAIYQSFMFELDFGNIVGLVLLQLFVGLLILFLFPNLLPFKHEKTSYMVKSVEIVSRAERFFHDSIIYFTLFVLLMMGLALLETTLDANMFEVYFSSEFFMSLIRSTLIACLAGVISTVAAVGLLKCPFIQTMQSYISILPVVIPTVTLGAGLYIFIGRHFPDLSLLFVILINALVGLPFALRLLQGRLHAVHRKYHQRILEIRLTPEQQWKFVEKPLLYPSLKLSFALVTAISFGDLGAIILFSSHENPTLTALMYQYIESLDMQGSACIAFALLVCISALFIFIQNMGGTRAKN